MADERDPKVLQCYREMGAEEPPRELDARILAASRRSVERKRWYGPVAIAAVLMLAVAVTVQLERQKPDEEVVVASAPTPAQKEVQAQSVPAEAPKVQEKKRFTPEPQPPAARENVDTLAKRQLEEQARSDSA